MVLFELFKAVGSVSPPARYPATRWANRLVLSHRIEMPVSRVNSTLLQAFGRQNETATFRIFSEVPGTSAVSLGGPDKENQDRLSVIDYVGEDSARNFRLYALADGVGGLTAGGRCAETAFAALVQGMILSDARDVGVRLGNGIRFANEEIYSVFKGDGATTLTVLAISNNGRLLLASVGDSRAYRYASAASPPTLEQLTEDDTIGNQVALAKGEKQRKTSPGGLLGQLTQAVGSDSEISLTIASIRNTPGDAYLLTSDGFHSVGRDNMTRALSNANRVAQPIEKLAHMARWLGTRDDISCIFCRSPEAPDSTQDHQIKKGGLLHIHSLHGTSSIFRVFDLLDAGKPQWTRDEHQQKKTSAGKKKSKRRRPKNKGTEPNNEEEKSQTENRFHPDTKGGSSASTSQSESQQELEINYIESNGD